MNQLAKIVSRYRLSGNICKLISKCINISIKEPEIINMANIELLSGQILGKIPHGMYTYKNLYECIDKVLKNTKEQYYVIYLNNEQLKTNMYYEYKYNYYVKTAQIHNNVIFDLINVNCDVIRIVSVACIGYIDINPEIVRVFDTAKFSSIDDQDYVMISDLLDVTSIYEEEQYNMQLQKDIGSGVVNEANEYLQNYLNNTDIKIHFDLEDQLYYSPDKRFKTLKELCNIRKKMVFKDCEKEYRGVKAPVIMKFKKKNKCSVCEKIDSNILMCARCKNTYYCSTKCQHIDYPNHKTICRPHMTTLKFTTPPLPTIRYSYNDYPF